MLYNNQLDAFCSVVALVAAPSPLKVNEGEMTKRL